MVLPVGIIALVYLHCPNGLDNSAQTLQYETQMPPSGPPPFCNKPWTGFEVEHDGFEDRETVDLLEAERLGIWSEGFG